MVKNGLQNTETCLMRTTVERKGQKATEVSIGGWEDGWMTSFRTREI